MNTTTDRTLIVLSEADARKFAQGETLLVKRDGEIWFGIVGPALLEKPEAENGSQPTVLRSKEPDPLWCERHQYRAKNAQVMGAHKRWYHKQ